MNPEQVQGDVQEVEAAIYAVALALDAYLVNGIQYGVLQGAVFPGFLEKTASNVQTALAKLEQHARCPAVTDQSKVSEVQAALRTKCQQMLDLVTGLGSFMTLPLEQLRRTVTQIPLLREEGALLIQELETCFQTPKPFYQTRPSHSSAMVKEFLANLERIFEEQRSDSKVGAG